MPSYFVCRSHILIAMLKIRKTQYYTVKSGQSILQIADCFSVSPYLLAEANSLEREPYAGQVLVIPTERGNAYTVREGDTKALLFGGEEGFRKKNGQAPFYPGCRVIL